MAVVIEKLITREELLQFLQELVKNPATAHDVVKTKSVLLHSVIEGVIALGYGEVRKFIAPSPKKKRSWYGTKPYTLWKLEMGALGFGDLLKKKKYKIDDKAPIRAVAAAYGLTPDQYRGWRKRKSLAKTTD
jgi:hypothetical protein